MKELENVVDAYNEAWNRQDLDAICAAHAPGMVFENHNAGERAEGEAVRAAHRLDLRQLARPTVRGALALHRRTASSCRSGRRPRRIPTARSSRGTGVDIFPFAGDKILRKDVYSNASRRVPEQLAEQRSA